MAPATSLCYSTTRATMSGAPWMSLAFVACLLAASVDGNGFSTQYRGHTQHPSLAGHCLYEELDLAVPLNGYVLPSGQQGYCIRLECTDDYLLLIRHCDKQPWPRPGCHLSPNDYDFKFPECCPQLECSDEY
ncbi:uncharacterized protein LOC6617632 [Drosophila sechellia]|nr:uncharacterized protein LOC6617632 [Drosophila sechellia]XP_032580141.1 uncharacterized protein LOC6617632 [Drosophila sechellia]XP_032580142.1 uncharacterized protein LOC6617632 [Drosophila sechellia]